MLFFESEQAFKEALSHFEEQTGTTVTNTNSNGPVGEEWGVNFVDVQINREFVSFIESHYIISNKYYVKGRKYVEQPDPAPS